MWNDPDAALERQQHRQALRQRLQESQREDLIAAARVLIPEQGIFVPLGRIAVYARLSRSIAQALFNTTTDLAFSLVVRAWLALIEATAPAESATPQDFVAGLIRAIRADADTHDIYQALRCGTPLRLRRGLAEAEARLARALGYGLRETWPAIAHEATTGIGHLLLGLARQAALADEAPDASTQAALITALLSTALAHPAAAAEPPAAAETEIAPPPPAAAPVRVPSPPAHHHAYGHAHQHAHRHDHATHPAAAPPLARVHDPPSRAA